MYKRTYNYKGKARYKGIINYIKGRFNLRSQFIKLVGALIILMLLLFLRFLNTSISNNIIQIVENSINYEFSLREDGARIMEYSKRFLRLPERALTTFNLPDISDTGNFPLPIDGTIYKPFGEIKYISGKTDYNKGIDILVQDENEPVAIDEGLVRNIEYIDGKGYFVTIEHQEFDTVYGYLADVNIGEGEEVSQDTQIGSLGVNSKDGKKYLHFEILIEGKPVNPLNFIDYSQ